MAVATDYRQHLEVETPEHVVIDYEIAGLGSRGLATIIDTTIVILQMVALLFVMIKLREVTELDMSWIFPLVQFGLLWGYFAFFEGFRDGQTPGKRWMGIRVIRDTGHPVTMREAAARNILRVVDFMPPPYLLGILFVAFHPRGKRIGDLVAGTVVVRDRPTESPAPTAEEELPAVAGAPQLGDEEYRVLREFVARAPKLPGDARTRLALPLAARLADRYPTRPANHVAFLTQAYRDETARRRSRFAAGGQRSAAERLVARKGGRWDAFDRMAMRATQRGLDDLTAAELPDFAARYREVAADLARVRTYGADARTRLRLERLVATGHNLLYRDDRKTWTRLGRFVAIECPAAVVHAWRLVLLAALAFSIPALGGYAALRERPALAEEVLPAVMLERAEEGKRELAAGRGYAQAQSDDRASIASFIATNNMGVAFSCFAGGIVLGVGSLASLAFNGLALGAATAHFQNNGLLAYLWTFIAGHGVLELFAIFCAGAAGLLLGLAIVRPGAYSRRDALVLNARTAMRLVGTAVVLLLVAGAIEGFLSTSGASPTVKFVTGAATALLLVAYLGIGARSTNKA
ncbi:MAG: stage II sporulation protein M [Gemmatimonadaceae bacterium]|nr:stage II sporulation protein M [Gemmatimonadaceae bacterium]